MRHSIILILVIFTSLQTLQSQQWTERQYTYESRVDEPYGTATTFTGAEETLHMDIFLPTCGDSTVDNPRPLLMWVHGGAFLDGSKEDPSIQELCKNFAERGYVTASIDYRKGFVSDELNWECNFPNYDCVFATDSAEWARAYYRAVQDGKGALRYLINRHEEFNIDTSNVFLAGESAGSFIALGVGLLDTITERPIQTYATTKVPPPHVDALACVYNQGIDFGEDSITRPDLGGIEGTIEPTDINFTIKGIGNMFGAMLTDLLRHTPVNKHKPAIYSFHRPCDLIVPIDSNFVYWGLNWCFTNGYGCYAIANNRVMLYGSRTFSNWNTTNNYGFTIQDEFTNVNFPYFYPFGEASCLAQFGTPCHAYDSKQLRETNLATFFSNKISADPTCTIVSVAELSLEEISIFPNPVNSLLELRGEQVAELNKVMLYDALGKKVHATQSMKQEELSIDLSSFPAGLYILHLQDESGATKSIKVVKN